MISIPRIMAFMRDHPGVLALVDKFPKFEKATWSKLNEFMERALREDDPEEFIVKALERALGERPEPITQNVTVVGRKDNK